MTTSVEKFTALGLRWEEVGRAPSRTFKRLNGKRSPNEFILSPNEYDIRARLRVYPNGSAWWMVYGVASSIENTGEANAKELACTAVLKRIEILAEKSEKALNNIVTLDDISRELRRKTS